MDLSKSRNFVIGFKAYATALASHNNGAYQRADDFPIKSHGEI